MGTRVTLVVETWVRASPATVFGLVTDGATWPNWSPIGSFRLEREGDDGGESVGAIRVFKTGFAASREQIVDVRPGAGLSYVLLSGLPIRNHRADVELTPRDGGTAVVWREAFDPTIPGTGAFFRVFLRAFVGRCAKGLAAYAPKVTEPGDLPQQR
jgi:uncharacterized protein YndB with AHSA1/START domain